MTGWTKEEERTFNNQFKQTYLDTSGRGSSGSSNGDHERQQQQQQQQSKCNETRDSRSGSGSNGQKVLLKESNLTKQQQQKLQRALAAFSSMSFCNDNEQKNNLNDDDKINAMCQQCTCFNASLSSLEHACSCVHSLAHAHP